MALNKEQIFNYLEDMLRREEDELERAQGQVMGRKETLDMYQREYDGAIIALRFREGYVEAIKIMMREYQA